jgi:hypothetical protein
MLARRASRSKHCLRASPNRSQIRNFAAAPSSISPQNFRIGSTPVPQLHAPTKWKCAGACVFLLALSTLDPRRLGEQLALLIDGAYGHAVTLGAAALRRELIEMATLLIDAQVPKS